MKSYTVHTGPTQDSPKRYEAGISIHVPETVSSLRANQPMMLYGCLRLSKSEFQDNKPGMPARIFLSAVELFTQQPNTLNLLGQQIVFEDDILEEDDDYLFYFDVDLKTALQLHQSPLILMIHASAHQHVSDIITIETTP